MLPVEILISEHRLIEPMIAVLEKEQQKIVVNNKVDPNFIVTVVDFFRTYADRYHHGKEEGLLFNALQKRQLSDADAKMMQDLIMEHALARRTVNNLESSKNSYIGGETSSIDSILQSLTILVELYPKHIEKEDKHFFYPIMKYFSTNEQEDMVSKFLEYDRNFTDRKYKQILENLIKLH